MNYMMWDEEDPTVLHILQESATYLCFKFGWEIFRSSSTSPDSLSTVAVADGGISPWNCEFLSVSDQILFSSTSAHAFRNQECSSPDVCGKSGLQQSSHARVDFGHWN